LVFAAGLVVLIPPKNEPGKDVGVLVIAGRLALLGGAAIRLPIEVAPGA
jgi:hypothetical protein